MRIKKKFTDKKEKQTNTDKIGSFFSSCGSCACSIPMTFRDCCSSFWFPWTQDRQKNSVYSTSAQIKTYAKILSFPAAYWIVMLFPSAHRFFSLVTQGWTSFVLRIIHTLTLPSQGFVNLILLFWIDVIIIYNFSFTQQNVQSNIFVVGSLHVLGNFEILLLFSLLLHAFHFKEIFEQTRKRRKFQSSGNASWFRL